LPDDKFVIKPIADFARKAVATYSDSYVLTGSDVGIHKEGVDEH
jgi:hypothetical protein